MYEPEIDAFLRAVADVDYMLVDGGANFGLWSVLASSRVITANWVSVSASAIAIGGEHRCWAADECWPPRRCR